MTLKITIEDPGYAAVVNVATETSVEIATLGHMYPGRGDIPAGTIDITLNRIIDLVGTIEGANGDMTAAVYDPGAVASDAFDMDNMVEGFTNLILSGDERSKLAGIEAGADVTDATNVAAAGAVMTSAIGVTVAAYSHTHADKADLVGGVIPTSQIPAIAISDFLGEVANQAAMLALTGQRGDWCVRTDSGNQWILSGDDASVLGNWVELSHPTAPVTSVNGQTGVVVLGKGDVGLGNVDNTADADKPVSSAQQTAINASTQSNISGAAEKTTPADADKLGILDSAAAGALKWLSWSNLKATLKTYFDTLYSLAAHTHSGVYEPADGTILKDADIGDSVQAYDAVLDAPVGKQTHYVPASAMIPSVANGCTDLTTTAATTSGRADISGMVFSGSADQSCQFSFELPKQWDEGTITYKVHWTSLTTADADSAVFGLAAVAISDGDSLDSAMGTEVTVTDAFASTAKQKRTSAESAAVTIAGTPAAGDTAHCIFWRRATNGSDTIAEEVTVLGVTVHWTNDALRDD